MIQSFLWTCVWEEVFVWVHSRFCSRKNTIQRAKEKVLLATLHFLGYLDSANLDNLRPYHNSSCCLSQPLLPPLFILFLKIFYWKVKVSPSVMSDCLQPHGLGLARLLSVGFSREEYWSGLRFPSSGDLPDPGIEPVSPALQADSWLLSQWECPCSVILFCPVLVVF